MHSNYHNITPNRFINLGTVFTFVSCVEQVSDMATSDSFILLSHEFPLLDKPVLFVLIFNET